MRETRSRHALAIDHFRYFAGVIRSDEGSVAELDSSTVSLNVHEPLGVVAQIIPWNFPLPWPPGKSLPALAAGNCVVIKPAEQTPVGILVWAEMIQHLLPPGALNIVNGFGIEAGKPLFPARV
ncbi:MAG: aldehyde dehydrogenase family protein [Saprospiraceae bacterium]